MKESKNRHRLMASMALLSVSLIAYQVAVIQLLSYVQWYHYANMVISIALLGFGAAGALLSLKRDWLLKHSNNLLPSLMIFCGLMMAGAVELSHSSFARFDSYLLFTDRLQWLKLLVNSLLYFIPFLLGALALGIVFIKYVHEIGGFYFANLAGSGIGAVLAAVLAWYFFPASLPFVMALVAVMAGLLLLNGTRHWYIIVLALPVVVFIFYRTTRPFSIELSEYKSLSKTMNLPSARITIQKPGPYGLVQMVSADALRYAPGLSLAFENDIPVKSVLLNNGDWYGPVDSWNASDSFHLLDYTTIAVPYVLKKRNRVLILNAATGLHISHALSHGALQIDAVEPHRGVYDLLLHELVAVNDSIMYRHEVKMHNTESRSFLSATDKKYDLIQLPMSGSFGGGVGLYAMQEEYGLTKEAFLKMWNLLEEDGVISITAWMDYPFRNALKITATLAETLKGIGIEDTHLHIAAVRSWGTVSFLLKKTPLSVKDELLLRKFCNDYFFDPLWLPGLKAEERTFYNAISDSTFFIYADELLSGDREKLYREYGFHLRPATDDKPYFSQFLRWKSLPQLAGIFGSQTVSFLELGWLIAAVSFLQISLLAILLIIFPLSKLGLRGGHIRWTLLYFSGLGAGYMLLEIVLIQKFILFFGNAIYAASFVISIMMLSSGAGSYYSTRILPTRMIMQRILMMIFLILVLYTFFLSPLLNQVAGYTDLIKLFISLPLVALPAILMGMPFPLGLRALAAKVEKNVPWAWGINSCVSVISASLAAILAVEAGFSTVILFAAIFYAVSMLSMYLFKASDII
jgi:predicted membrane-bound spermidine synthase